MSEKYFIQKETLTAIADTIREATGSTEPISFETESIKTTLKTTIENSGGSGEAVKTCDVTIINEVNDFFSVAYMHPEDGLDLTSVGGVGSTDILTLTIADNSMLCICPMPNNFTLTNVEDRRVLSGEALTLHISNPSGGSATITLSNSSPDMPPDPI